MAACLSWSSGKVAIARLTAIPSYVTMESAARHSRSFSEFVISSPLRFDCGCDIISTNGIPIKEDDNKARLVTATSQSRQG
ncbi:hypothetical protein TIFTF001_003349 [Ficus carica]|uniref:Uncharacterized protein n=1 Tax=Ficus carica TaxID=3494 RepID=A0AA87ZZ23_FICCA|nr:hypothetical protein TIFTF001_003349 [Ficus carica]